jgi:DNA-binding response OmpR family regulator
VHTDIRKKLGCRASAFNRQNIHWRKSSGAIHSVLITTLVFEGIARLEFIRKFRAKNKQKYREVPILVLTEEISKEHVLALPDAGVSDVMLYPFDPGALRIRAYQCHY